MTFFFVVNFCQTTKNRDMWHQKVFITSVALFSLALFVIGVAVGAQGWSQCSLMNITRHSVLEKIVRPFLQTLISPDFFLQKRMPSSYWALRPPDYLGGSSASVAKVRKRRRKPFAPLLQFSNWENKMHLGGNFRLYRRSSLAFTDVGILAWRVVVFCCLVVVEAVAILLLTL